MIFFVCGSSSACSYEIFIIMEHERTITHTHTHTHTQVHVKIEWKRVRHTHIHLHIEGQRERDRQKMKRERYHCFVVFEKQRRSWMKKWTKRRMKSDIEQEKYTCARTEEYQSLKSFLRWDRCWKVGPWSELCFGRETTNNKKKTTIWAICFFIDEHQTKLQKKNEGWREQEGEEKEVNHAIKQQYIDLILGLKLVGLFSQIEYTNLNEDRREMRFFFLLIKRLTVPSDALAPTRVPRLFQHTSKMPPVPR